MLRLVIDPGGRSVVHVSRRVAAQSSVARTDRRPPLSLAAVLVLLTSTLLLSCADDPTGSGPTPPNPGAPRRASSVRVSPASAALTAVGATVQLTAEVRDQNGQPITGATVEWTSSTDSVAVVDSMGLTRAAGNGEATITAAAGTVSGSVALTVRQVASTVSVSPSADTLVAGDTVRLAADALDENGHAVRGAVFSWSSGDSSVATVDTLGLVTALSQGEAIISAASGPSTGQMELIVLPRVSTAIDVMPAMVALAALGDTVRLAAEVRDQVGRVIEGAMITWSSLDEAVVTVDSAGLVTAAGGGMTGVTAKSEESSGTAAVSVMQVAGSVIVSPAADTLAPGDTLRLAADAFDANGHQIEGPQLSWSSSDPAVATVDTLGLVRAVSPGEANIVATSGSATGRMAVLVVMPAATVISLTPDPLEFGALGDTVRLAAEVLDQFGRVFEDAAVFWSSSDETVATVDRGGLVTAAGMGTADITASSGAASGAVAVIVTQIVSSVVVSPAAATIAPRATVALEAEAFDWNVRPVADAEFSWTSSDAAVAAIDGTGVALGIADGVATITAQAGYARGASKIAVGNPDRGALVALYNATEGPNWSRSDNWLTDAPLAEWHGVRVDGRGRVSHVNLDKNSIGGRLPAELGHLTALVDLSLRDNRLAGPIPPALGRLSKLEHLELQGNQLAGSIPAELGNLRALRSMAISRNRLTGPIPRELGKLDKLEDLILVSNELTGPIPGELGNLASLQGLNLVDNHLTGRIPPELGQLDNLAFLWLYRNQLTGSIPPELERLRNLRVLGLAANSLTGSIPAELGKLAMLEDLILGSNELTGPIPPELGKLAMLEVLNLNANQITGSIPPELGGLANLRELHLWSNELTGSIPPELGNLAALRRLWFSSNRLTGPLPPSLVQLGELDQLFFWRNDGVCVPGTTAFVAWIGDIDAHGGPLCNESDQAGLIAFFEVTGGDNWTRSEGWLGEGALAEWHGVVADSLGRVRTLDLTRNGLVGRLPATLGQLAQLNTLLLDDNSLAGQLPTGLAELPLLEFSYSRTDLCIPPDDSFQAWLEALPVHNGTGRTCGILSDREILLALYEGTGGSQWEASDNWLTDAPLDQWHGVEVSTEGRVVGLHMRSNDLIGTIPPELGALGGLQVLDFGFNELKGTIPPELGGLGGLQVLDFGANELKGTIPPELGGLASLRELHLWGNYLTGAIPPELGELANLEALWLAANELTGSIPPELGDLVSLRKLDFWGNELTGIIPSGFGKLHNLNELDLFGNQLSGTIPASLGELGNLTHMELAGNQISGPIPSELGNLQNLRQLGLGGNQLSGPIPPELGKPGSLESLSVANNQLTGSVPPELGGLDRLIHLNLSENPGMSGPLPSELADLARIETLSVAETDLCAPSDKRFLTWLEGLADGYVPQCPPDEGEAMAYLTQAAEPRTFRVPLVGGERALLRVFVAATRKTSLGIPPVRATFYLNGSEVHVAEIPGRRTAIPTQLDEGDLTASANAEIPGRIIRPGLEMEIVIDPEGTLPATLGIPRRIPGAGRMEVEVREMPVLDLTLIPFLWSEAPDSSIVNTVEAMAAHPESHELLWATNALLPVGDMSVTAHEPVMSSSNDIVELALETQAIRIMEGATSHYMGMLPDHDRGGVIGAALRPGRTSFSVARASTIAHELGHNMSLEHAPCNVFGPVSYPHDGGSIGVWGYDFRSGGRTIPPGTADLMSYCRPRWISDYHFAQALRFRLADEGADAAASAGRVRPVRSLLLWGGADADSVPFLEPAFVVDAPEALPVPGGVYELIGRTDDGGVLFSLSFDMPAIADGEGRAAFVFALPVEISQALEFASITLSGPGGAVTLDGGTDRPMTILRNPRSGQVRAFLRHARSVALREAAADVGALALEGGLEALFSRGIPDAREWRR
ncbi:leucine-rich repeat domain-containing protein [Candidatus Palauibacter sp.]|uniref:leucine-rich repeat domain-containing protein n=1 Tax=Candidatus Palauibacter sp. TaxID=3101350 RepID=UPI003B52293C